MTNHRTLSAAALVLAAALAACSSGGGSSSGRSTSSSTASGATASGTTGAAPIVPFNPGERAGLGPWQLTLVTAAPGVKTTVDLALTNPGAHAAAPPPTSIFELVDLTSRQRYQVTGARGLDARVPARGTVPVTLTFATGNAPANAVLAWKGSGHGSVDAAFALTAAPTPD